MTFPNALVPNTFASQAGPIPLSQLDANFTALQTAINYVSTATKAANTSRASNVVLANDPDLVYAVPTAGTYRIDAYLYYSYSDHGGFSLNLNYSGAFTSGAGGSSFVSAGGSEIQGNGFLIQNSQTTSATSYNLTTLGSYASIFTLSGVLIATGAGNLGLSWAQAQSNAIATILYAGSYLSVTRVL